MTERPIIMGAESVRAILAGRKTQTRRMVRIDDRPISAADADALRRQRGIPSNARNVRMLGYLKCDAPAGSHTVSSRVESPYGLTDDRLWVREAFSLDALSVYPCPPAWYRADRNEHDDPASSEHDRFCKGPQDGRRYADCFACTLDGRKFRWRSPLYMPRWASRLTLEITEVRVQRLQQIDGRDVLAEGVDNGKSNPAQGARWENMQRIAFEERWNSINGKRAAWASNPWVWAVTFRRVS